MFTTALLGFHSHMTVTLKLPDGSTKELRAKEIAEHNATQVCEQYGWDKYSAAWYTLVGDPEASPAFIRSHALEMFPGAEIAQPITA